MKVAKQAYSGKFGSVVEWIGRNGIIRRRHFIPRNPRTPAQMEVRRLVAGVSRRFSDLTDQQIQAWNEAAAGYHSAVRLRQSGPLTGLQLFMKLNCKLGLLGLPPLDTPPPPPDFPELTPEALVITNVGGSKRVLLACSGDTGQYTVLRASRPVNCGVRRCLQFRFLGLCPSPVDGFADITARYTALFGLPPVGKRIFVRATVMVDGCESEAREFTARVPSC